MFSRRQYLEDMKQQRNINSNTAKATANLIKVVESMSERMEALESRIRMLELQLVELKARRR